MFQTFNTQTPLWIFEELVAQYSKLPAMSIKQKQQYVGKLYFYTQQINKDIDVCYSYVKLKRTQASDKVIKTQIKQLIRDHKLLEKLKNI